MNAESNLVGTRISKPISSVNSRRVSVIKWSGKELNNKISSKSDLSVTKDKSSLSSPDSTVIMKSSNEEGKYLCSFCEKSFKWRSHWKSHERIHTGERPFKCEICEKTFTRSDGLQCHKVNHIRNNSEFYNNDATKNALLNVCHPEWPKNNDVVSQENMKSTDQTATRLFYCSICSRVFLSSAGLIKHFRSHKGIANQKSCEVCKKVFTKRSALEIHSRVHTGIKPYRCNICSKTFSIHGNLKRHLLIHSGERPYKCAQCLQCFNSPSHLKRHLKTRHINVIK